MAAKAYLRLKRLGTRSWTEQNDRLMWLRVHEAFEHEGAPYFRLLVRALNSGLLSMTMTSPHVCTLPPIARDAAT